MLLSVGTHTTTTTTADSMIDVMGISLTISFVGDGNEGFALQ